MDTKSAGCRSTWLALMTGVWAGCCMDRKALMEATSDSYELSAIVFPLEASRHAAIHLAYCSSCRGGSNGEGVEGAAHESLSMVKTMKLVPECTQMGSQQTRFFFFATSAKRERLNFKIGYKR